ncbi:MAG: type IX secretion system protein PorQ [Ignavibacteria bacterium]|nr:type IX secretion system protein PorQ [Ignavibacteria bacterium]
MKNSIFLLLLFFGQLCFAKDTPFNFLRYSGSARSSALAGAFVSIADDPSAMFYNPASVSTISTRNFSFTFFKHVLDVNSGSVSYHKKFERIGHFAVSATYTNYGSFDRTNSDGQLIGNFSANDFALGATYSNLLDTNLYYGATLKLISSNIDKYSSIAVAVDFGLLYLIPEKNTSIGFSILHSGTQLKTFDGNWENLPLDVRIGISHRLRGLPLLLNFNFYNLADRTNKFFDRFLKFSIGGEFYFGEYLNLRFGYDNNIRKYSGTTKDKEFIGFAAGLGLKFKEFNLDYSISQVGASAIFHKFSLYISL